MVSKTDKIIREMRSRVGEQRTPIATDFYLPNYGAVKGAPEHFITDKVDSVYLRVDGTNQMTADLNVGNNDINNADQVNCKKILMDLTFSIDSQQI